RQRVDDLGRLGSAGFDGDRRAGPGRQHHQPHDRGAADDLVAALHLHLGIEFFHRLHELRRGARVQPLLVADLEHADDRRRVRRMIGGRKVGHAGGLAHFPVRTRLAMVMYLRPESWAAATASVSGHSARTLASFTSIGRLMPARTSTFGRPITEIARLDGVPPNISVRIAPPWPLAPALPLSVLSLGAFPPFAAGPILPRLDLLLRAPHVLQGRAELGGEAPMGNKYEADHGAPRRRVPVAPHERPPIMTIRSLGARAFPAIWERCCIAAKGALPAPGEAGNYRAPVTFVPPGAAARIMTEVEWHPRVNAGGRGRGRARPRRVPPQAAAMARRGAPSPLPPAAARHPPRPGRPPSRPPPSAHGRAAECRARALR